jgi:outer membrane biosynthesis protein TonB
MSNVASLLTALRVPEQRDRTLAWAVVISIAIHALLLSYGLYRRSKAIPIDLTAADRNLPVEVALVEPPQNPIPTDRLSRNLSVVSSEASDLDPRDTQADVPSGTQLIEETPPSKPGANASDGGRKTEGEDQRDESGENKLPDQQEGLSEAVRNSRARDAQGLEEPHDFMIPVEPAPDFGGDGSASLTIGNITLNTTAWDYAPYILDLKRRLRQKWIPPVAFSVLGAIHGYTWVRFRIYADGHMESLAVEETEGHDSLHRSSVNAVKGAAPFRPLPEDFPEDFLEIAFGFYYLLPGDEDRFFRDGRPIRKDDRTQDDKGSP